MPKRNSQARNCPSSNDLRLLLELLGLTLENEQAVLGANSKPIRHAMMVRVEKYIRNNLADPDLDPEKIAQATGMSPRYLHKLFEEAGKSVVKWSKISALAPATLIFGIARPTRR